MPANTTSQKRVVKSGTGPKKRPAKSWPPGKPPGKLPGGRRPAQPRKS